MDETPPEQRSWLRRFLNRLEVDRAVFFAVAARGWQLVAGPVVLVLIARYFSSDVQGYYYTFASLLGLQAFFELGLRFVTLNLASHEWALLGLDAEGRIVGDANANSRLISLGRRAGAWFAAAALVFILGVGAAGFAFFQLSPEETHIDWQTPWSVLVVLTGLQLALTPMLAILDGCRQMPVVNRYRLAQAVTSSLAGWACIVLEGGLWTAVAMAAVRLAWDAWIVAIRYRTFFAAFLLPPAGPQIEWREEVLPLQWRFAIQAAFAWFSYASFAPVVFRYWGAAEGGRMGLTWAALTALHSGATAWVDTRVPLFGGLIARRDWRELDRVFFRVSRVSLGLLAGGFAAACLVVWGLRAIALAPAGSDSLPASLVSVSARLGDRILPPPPTALFCLGLLFYAAMQYELAYLIAHKRNPLLAVSIVSHALTGAAVWYFGARYGAVGAGAAYAFVQGCVALPLWTAIWLRCRRQWHTGRPMSAC